ncbi:hypothetical protein QFC19_000631 [Naganishia cerealis]|uniref:Uncharacterized protein n=1 Tax=Naganishia cerealis TaxID=610337 RepID=A0ACC2WMD2_9TREE|nr:hypothetical protein QFC19_000631 [Naganishia cerealis]
MKVTVKHPSMAFRILAPLNQVWEASEDKSRSLSDYTYDRFQVKFKSATDIDAFLYTLYAHFPAMDASVKRHKTRAGSADSVAPSQNTQISIPGFSFLNKRHRSPSPPRMDESVHFTARGKPYDESMYPAQKRTDTPKYDVNTAGLEDRGWGDELLDSHDTRSFSKHIPYENSVQHSVSDNDKSVGGKYTIPRAVRGEDHYRPSATLDGDGFVKPYAPAVIDTPTPANRIYHLKQVDPNVRKVKQNFNPSSVSSPSKKPANPVDRNDLSVREKVTHGKRADLDIQRKHTESFHSRQEPLLPGIRLDDSLPGPQGEVEESMDYPTGMTQIVFQYQAEQIARQQAQNSARNVSTTKDSPHSLRHILAPETVATSGRLDDSLTLPAIASSETPKFGHLPSIYGAQEAIRLSDGYPGDSNLDAAETVQRVAEKSKPGPMEGVMPSRDSSAEGRGLNDQSYRSPCDPPRTANTSFAQAPTSQNLHQETLQQVTTDATVTQPLTATITRPSSLYTLSAENLDAVINEILAEDGFVAFVCNKS